MNDWADFRRKGAINWHVRKLIGFNSASINYISRKIWNVTRHASTLFLMFPNFIHFQEKINSKSTCYSRRAFENSFEHHEVTGKINWDHKFSNEYTEKNVLLKQHKFS